MAENARFVAGEVKSTAGVVLDSLRQAILIGDIAGGTQLKQNEIAAAFNVSAAPVREALHSLVASGLATQAPNRGVTVAVMSERDFLDIMELRALLEPRALELSAPRLTTADLSAAEAILDAVAVAGGAAERAELHWQFHLALYDRADRPRLLAQIESLYVAMSRYWCPVWNKVGLSENWRAIHGGIVDVLRRGAFDDAVRMTEDQINAGRERWQSEFKRKLGDLAQ
ncbi:MAG: GntR family transcriptional regulator [Pseudomonadota bacterium]